MVEQQTVNLLAAVRSCQEKKKTFYFFIEKIKKKKKIKIFVYILEKFDFKINSLNLNFSSNSP
jgi:hypothetical protein